MVVIINGEIVPDNDPRAVARRGSSTTTQQQQPLQNRGARVASFGDLGSNNQRRASAHSGGGGSGPANGPPVDDDVDGLLTPLSKIIGIAGKRVEIPPVPRINFAGYSFPLVHVVVSVLAMLLFGNWRYFIVAFLALAILNPK